MATFPVTLGVRGLQRLTGRASEASDADLRVPSAPINAALDAALRIEGALLRVVNLPIGSSLMAVATKVGDGPLPVENSTDRASKDPATASVEFSTGRGPSPISLLS